MNAESKQCRKCLVVKPSEGFFLQRKTRDGLASWCKQCVRERVRQKDVELTSAKAKAERERLGELNLRDVFGWPKYVISDNGRVFIKKTWRELRQHLGSVGYYMVQLNSGVGRKRIHSGKCIHSLVLEAFVGPRPTGYQCAHEDGNKINNHISNLSWKTPRDNNRDKFRHGRQACGEDHYISKLNGEKVLQILDLIRGGKTDWAISKGFGVVPSTIYDIRKNRTWRHIPRQ